MQVTNIEWVFNTDGTKGFTHNPLTGCTHNCFYCYAQKIANRFRPKGRILGEVKHMQAPGQQHDICVLDKPMYKEVATEGLAVEAGTKKVICPFPFGFRPTYHRYRLIELVDRVQPTTIFLDSMADIMDDVWPDNIIEEIIAIMALTTQHRYLLLTKNPIRYNEFLWPENAWLGQTLDMQNIHPCKLVHPHTFISFEPLLADRTDQYDTNMLIETLEPNWVIVGAKTQPYQPPTTDSIDKIQLYCEMHDIKLFLKNNLKPLDLSYFPQEIPWVVNAEAL